VNSKAMTEEYRLTYWAQIMRERTESGMSIRAYCASAGFHENIYYYWQRKLRETASSQLSDSPTVPLGWAICAPSAAVVSMTNPAQEQAAIIIEIGQCRVAATADTDTELLAKICRVLTAL